MKQSFNKTVKAIGDYHLKHRGRLGLAFGLVVGVGATYTGFGQDLAMTTADAIFNLSQESEVVRIDAKFLMLQNLAALTVLISLGSDVWVHKLRTKGQEIQQEPPQGPV